MAELTEAVPGITPVGDRYTAVTVAHCESVLRSFYDFHLEAGAGPLLNRFPPARSSTRSRPGEPHSSTEGFGGKRRGRYRPKVVTVADVDPGQQLITVIREGTGAMQPLPTTPDVFVWLRLYQTQTQGLVSSGRDEPLWWTLHRSFRALTYDAARAMFDRVNASLGTHWSLHDLRHPAAYRRARDPQMPLTDVQWVLGHAFLPTTQRYLPVTEEFIAGVLALHARQLTRDRGPIPAPQYRPVNLEIAPSLPGTNNRIVPRWTAPRR